MIFFVLVASSPSLGLQPQQAQASAYGLGDPKLPPAYIIVDGKVSRLQLEDEPISQDRIANYDRVPQGTISPGERFSLLIPQFPGILKDVQSTKLHVNDDVFN